MTGLERLQDGHDRLGLGLVALEQVDLEREPGRVDQQTNLNLRVSPAFLTHPDLAELVLVITLEMERRHVIHHQRRQPRSAGGVGQAGPRDLVAILAAAAAL